METVFASAKVDALSLSAAGICYREPREHSIAMHLQGMSKARARFAPPPQHETEGSRLGRTNIHALFSRQMRDIKNCGEKTGLLRPVARLEGQTEPSGPPP